jgi:DNA-binding NarL/FixJ family response regulator
MRRLRIVIADDHEVVVEGLRRILDRDKFEVTGVASDGRALIRAARKLHPDAIVTDIAMPRLNGIDSVREIHRRDPNLKIVFLTMHSEVAYATAALAAGAAGYVLKSAAGEELIEALDAAFHGRTYISKSIAKSVKDAREIRPPDTHGAFDLLTHRQREILQQIAEGRQVKEIAAGLKLSPKTIEFHKYRIMHLLNLRTVADLARYAQRRGIVE